MRFTPRSHSLLLLATLLLQLGTVAAAAPSAPGAIEIGRGVTLWSEVLSESRPLQIHLPASYETTRAHYPVLYLLDGDRNFLHALGAVEFLASGGRIPEHIVVSIPNVDRTRDLTPCKQGGEPCGADRFLRFLQQELIPWVDKEYRTERFRTLVGHSRGGQFAFYTLLNQPDAFNGYIAISPALWINDAAIFGKAAAQLAKLPAQRFLYFSDGNESVEITANVTRMVGVLEQQHPAALQWSHEHFGEDQHATTPHKSLYNGLERIFSGLNVDREVILTQGLAGVDAHYARLEARYGFKIEPPRGMLEWMGYFLLQQDRPAAALAFFERNVQRFANEASAYEALASGLDAVGRHEEAAAAYRKAYRRATHW